MSRILAVAVALVLCVSTTTSALPPAQRALLDGGIRFFNIQPDGPCGATGGGDVILVGSDNAERAYNFLTRNMGLQPHQAAGIMGNMQLESGILPMRLQNTAPSVETSAEVAKSSSLGWGIVQWTPAGKFINTQSPVSRAEDLGVQLQFLRDQLEGRTEIPEQEAGDDVRAAPNVEEAVYAFQGNTSGAPSPAGKHYKGYERPKDQTGSIPERLAYARGFLTQYGSNGATPQAPSGSTTGGCSFTGGGEMVGELALLVDRTWYEQFPERFVGLHHNSTPSVDIALPAGTPVYSMTAGKVVRAPINNGYGLGVEIETPSGVVIKYAHGLDGGQVEGARVGDTVQPGQRIMSVGSTGDSTGPHIHLEISLGGQNGIDVCPQTLLKALYEGTPIPSFESLPRSGCTR